MSKKNNVHALIKNSLLLKIGNHHLNFQWAVIILHSWHQRSLVTDHYKNIRIRKKIEILWELPKWDTETQSEQVLLEKWAWVDLLNAGLSQTFKL